MNKEMQEIEPHLKKCPFCKLPVRFIKRSNPYSDSNYTGYDIGCGTVGCYLEDGADYWFNERSIGELVELWNRRAYRYGAWPGKPDKKVGGDE